MQDQATDERRQPVERDDAHEVEFKIIRMRRKV
jgi:hypothetical protein